MFFPLPSQTNSLNGDNLNQTNSFLKTFLIHGAAREDTFTKTNYPSKKREKKKKSSNQYFFVEKLTNFLP